MSTLAMPDVFEAAIRCGQLSVAQDALERSRNALPPARHLSRWACRPGPVNLYQEAIADLDKARQPLPGTDPGRGSRRRIHVSHLEARCYDAMKVYRQSKLAEMLFALELDRRSRAAGWNIVSTTAHPGLTLTNLQTSGWNMGLDKPSARTAMFRQTSKVFPFLVQPPPAGALPALYAATSPDGRAAMRFVMAGQGGSHLDR